MRSTNNSESRYTNVTIEPNLRCFRFIHTGRQVKPTQTSRIALNLIAHYSKERRKHNHKTVNKSDGWCNFSQKRKEHKLSDETQQSVRK